MSIRCWKCDATFRPKGLFFYRKTSCPECGCKIDFDSIALTRNWNLILMTVIPIAVMLYKSWNFLRNPHETHYAGAEIVCAALAASYIIDYPLTCFLYNHFSYEELRSGMLKPSDRRFPRGTLALGLVMFALIIIAFLLLK